jgi:UDP-N-acetylglucosamine--N-acetylmuramyl-(pentapeptide) pyrophosphoryl-undecaprenol N-acetylglucosamine transferase
LICAGGTGGGVYPALAVHSALTSRYKDVEVLWVGGEGGMESDLVKRAGIPYRSIPAAGLHGVDWKALPRNLSQLARGAWDSLRILREFNPDVLFFTGGYVAVPMAFAGQHIPTLLYVPDVEPGLALRSLARFADCITVTAADTQSYFNKKVIVTGYPLRPDLSAWDRDQARSELGLSSEKPVLLVTGGSKGARSINKAVLANLPEFLDIAELVHITGQLDWEEVRDAATSLWTSQRTHYHVFPYLHEMGQALAAADLVVSRAGASALGEYPFFELPAILVPYPYAWRYQQVNADYLARHRAAVIIEDSRLQEELLDTVRVLLENPGKRENMQAVMRSLSKPDAAISIANHLVELAGE